MYGLWWLLKNLSDTNFDAAIHLADQLSSIDKWVYRKDYMQMDVRSNRSRYSGKYSMNVCRAKFIVDQKILKLTQINEVSSYEGKIYPS